MPIKEDDTEAVVRGEAGLLLLLLVFGLCGLLTWTGLFLGVRWSLSMAWTAIAAHQAAAGATRDQSWPDDSKAHQTHPQHLQAPERYSPRRAAYPPS
jgi:hypothetical protein